MNRKTAVMLALAAALLVAIGQASGQQMFGSNPEGKGVSAYIIKPREGVQQLPQGWAILTDASHANCQLANEVLRPQGNAGPLTTVSYELPKANYEVYICLIGQGKARVAGATDWVEVKVDGSYYKWAHVGSARDATRLSVEVAPSGAGLSYAGLCAMGDALSVMPVSPVLEKMRKGEPVTICLIGDSVTENAKGFRGGSRDFDHGNPGLLKRYLEEQFKTEVGYISHREPPGWPDDGDPAKIRLITVDGKEYRDGRVEVDRSKKIRLVNMGKGGAASNNAWMRLPVQFNEGGEWRLRGRSWIDYRQPNAQPILRYGVGHYKPDLVIINFGTNDANGSHIGWTPEDYLFHMKVLATMCQHDLGAAVILSTPHLWTRGTHQNPHTQLDMAEAIRAYARGSGFALADIDKEYGPNDFDGIHPGNDGHKHMADAYWKALTGKQPAKGITSGSTAAQFKDNGDGTVTDTKSNLMWTKSGGLADAPKSPEDAAAFIRALNAERKLGHNDWRLPSRDELRALIDPTWKRPALPMSHPFTDVKRYYISSTTGMRELMWLVDFAHGIPYFTGAPTRNEANNKGYVWPVRDTR